MIMSEPEAYDTAFLLERIRTHAREDNLRLTQHAQKEMAAEDIVLREVQEAIAQGMILENYPEHQRGACCLVHGFTQGTRPVHIVCTTAQPILIIITVYEPKPPKWITPTQRR
jgi:hypothetical protein